MKLKWKDVREIAILLEEKFPNEDNLILGSIHYSKSTPFSKEEQKNAISFYAFGPNQDQEEAEEIDVLGDSNWTGCDKTGKSTSGGMV